MLDEFMKIYLYDSIPIVLALFVLYKECHWKPFFNKLDYFLWSVFVKSAYVQVTLDYTKQLNP